MLKHPWMAESVSTTQLRGTLSQLKVFNAQRRSVLKKGYLVKQGHWVRNWKRRSFVLTSDSLDYYETEGARKPRGRIFVRDILGVEGIPESSTSFKLTTRHGKDFIIKVRGPPCCGGVPTDVVNFLLP